MATDLAMQACAIVLPGPRMVRLLPLRTAHL